MLTGDLVRVKISKERVLPLYLNRESAQWLEAAESLLAIFREGIGRTRGEIEGEIDELFGGGGKATLAHRGLAKVLEDGAEFEVVADIPPDVIREKVFTAAAAHRRELGGTKPNHGTDGETELNPMRGPRLVFRRDEVLATVAEELKVTPEALLDGLFADLRDENRMLSFTDTTAQKLIDRYNVALAQAVLLRSVRVLADVKGETPQRYRQLFRQMKFHRLLYRVSGSMRDGYTFHIDGPLSLFSATTRYGLQMALFLPALLRCRDFRLDAELRWGPKREPRSFHVDRSIGLIPHQADTGIYVPPEIPAFAERFRQVAPAWDLTEVTEIVELGREGVWVPDYRAAHKESGVDVFIEVVGFWKRSTLNRLLDQLPRLGPPRFVLVVSEKLKVDEDALEKFQAPILWFKEIPSAPELANLLGGFLKEPGETAKLF